MIAAVRDVHSIGSLTFERRLSDAAQRNDSLLCVGLDPVLDRLPAPLRNMTDVAEAIVAFNTGIIEATSDLVSVYKPNLAFYLAHGEAGVRALAETRRRIPGHIPVLLDAKVGDVGSTAEAYATAYFDTWGFDAVTVNPYLGEDSLAPFLRRADRGVIVVCKTSNPGSADYQDRNIDGQPLHQVVAASLAETTLRLRGPASGWSSLGIVAGANYPEQSERLRELLPHALFLIPGYGAQGGRAADAIRSLVRGTHGNLEGGLVSSSRGLLFPEAGATKDRRAWDSAIDQALRRAIEDLTGR